MDSLGWKGVHSSFDIGGKPPVFILRAEKNPRWAGFFGQLTIASERRGADDLVRQFDDAHGLLHVDLAVVFQQTVLRVVVVFAGDAVWCSMSMNCFCMSSISAIRVAFSAFRASISLMVLSRSV
jgi:hypothetical protein